MSSGPGELYLLLRAGDVRYAVPASQVLHLTPGALATVGPVRLTWHGQPLALADRRGEGAAGAAARPPLLVVRTRRGPAAILVDRVLGLIQIPGPCPAGPTARMTAQGLVVLLDGETLAHGGVPALPRFDAAAGAPQRTPSEVRQVLAFSPGAGPLRVCVPVSAVLEITRGLVLTPLGGAPFVTGVLSWQGRAVPLVALDRLLRLGPARGKAPARTLICRAERSQVLLAIPASRVWDIVPLPAGAALRPVPQALGRAIPLLRGVYLTARGPLCILDLDAAAGAGGLSPPASA